MKTNTEFFIKKSKDKHGDRYDYSLANVTHSRSIVNILCKYHGAFSQRAHHHMSGRGCPICKKRKTPDEFIKESNLVHNNLYTYENIIYHTNRIPVKITCSIHGDFLQSPSNRSWM